MNRYIDADELLELYDIDLDGLETDKPWTIPIEVVKQNIKDMPSADVKPIRHGQWIYGENEEGHDGYKCSECGKFIPWEYDKYDIDFIKEVHYCSNCGAKMDGEEQKHD